MTVSAEEAFNFNSIETQELCRELTSSDVITEEYTLDEYIADVKKGNYQPGTDAEMVAHAEILNKIIPIETFFTSGQYFYAGAEYAFLVWSTDSAENRVMIIDYDCTMDYEKNMVLVGANILQAVYGVQAYGNGYRATAYHIDSLFYIKAPKMYGSIRNLHQSNDFDFNYSKHTDDGIIFRGFQLFYQGVSFEESNDEGFLISTALSSLPSIIGDVLEADIGSFLIDTATMFVELAEGIETVSETVSGSTEYDLENFSTRNNQLADPTCQYFTKLAYAALDPELYINDYFKLGILLDGENVPSILNCGLSFQIASGYGDLIFEDPIEISFEKIIYNAIGLHEYENISSIYIFEGYKQILGFAPQFTANYAFSIDNSTCLINVYHDTYDINSYVGGELVAKNTNGTYTLQGNEVYFIEIVNNGNEIAKGELSSEIIAPIIVSGENTVNFDGFFKLDPALLRYYNFSLSSATITVYDSALNVLSSGSGSLLYEKLVTGTEYVSVSASSGTLNCSVYRKIIYSNLEGNDQISNFYNTSSFEFLVPERIGYTFEGWWLTRNYSDEQATVAKLDEINQLEITLYAKWSAPNLYTITYVFPSTTAEGYTVDKALISTNTFIYFYTIEDGVYLPEELDSVAYSLENWYKDEALTILAEYPAITTGNLTVYAKLNIKTYIVTFNANGGDSANCAAQEVSYGTTITLPSSTRTNYIGTWNVWGNADSYYPKSNFGTTYTVQGETSFVAQWLQIYSLSYENIQFGEQTAWIYFEYVFAPNYYVANRGLDLSLVRASLATATPYEPQFVFLGWYKTSLFDERATVISQTDIGAKTIYAKWRYDYSYTLRTEEYTVTDTDLSGQPYDTIYIGLNDTTTYNNLIALGFKYITIEFNLQLWEVSDSYIDLYFYKSSTIDDSNKLKEIKGIDYVHGSAGTSKTRYSVVLTFDIAQLEGVARIYIRYNSHGWWSDTWKNDICYIEAMYLVKKEDIDIIGFTLSDDPNYDTTSTIQ